MDVGIPAEPEMIKFFKKKRETDITTASTTLREPISHTKGHQNIFGIIRAGIGI